MILKKISVQPLLDTKKEAVIKSYQEDNETEIEVSLVDALEEYEVDETVMVESVDPKSGKIIKTPKIKETVIKYELIDGEIKERESFVHETQKVTKKRLKADHRLDETIGKIYRKVQPSYKEADLATIDHPKRSLPKWMADRL